jgi:hypothetical protein
MTPDGFPETPADVIQENIILHRHEKTPVIVDYIIRDLEAYGYDVVKREPMVSSGDVFEWRGIPGQYATERFIRIDSMSARCGVEAAILYDPDVDPLELTSIGLADLEVAIRLGFLVKVQT